MSLHNNGERIEMSEYSKLSQNEHRDRYRFACSLLKNTDLVLDCACGTGYGTETLAEKASKVVGVDLDESTIKQLNSQTKSNNILYVHASSVKLPLEDNSLDMVVSFETYEHMGKEEQDQTLKEFLRVLKPQGTLILSTPNKTVISKLGYTNEFHIREVTANELTSEIISAGFISSQLYFQTQYLGGNKKLVNLINFIPLNIRAVLRKFMGNAAEKMSNDVYGLKESSWPIQYSGEVGSSTYANLVVVCKKP